MPKPKTKKPKPPAPDAAALRLASMQWVSRVRSVLDALLTSAEDTLNAIDANPALAAVLGRFEVAELNRELADLACLSSTLWVQNPDGVVIPDVMQLIAHTPDPKETDR